MTFEEARDLLANCNRSELRDHAFGDREVYFADQAGKPVAEGYVGNNDYSITIGESSFTGTEASTLLSMGKLVLVERNDSLDDDHE